MKEKAIEILQQLAEKSPSIKSIYLWGSITTDEYVEGVSDIDSLAFVDEDTGRERQEKLNEILEEKLPGLKINFLYPSELNGGPAKSGLAQHVPVSSIMYGLPSMIYVFGNRINLQTFSVNKIPKEQIITDCKINIQQGRFISNIQPADKIYFIKALSKYLYHLNQLRMPFKPFKYSDLINDSDKSKLSIAQAILESKESGWNDEVIEKHISSLVEFAKNL